MPDTFTISSAHMEAFSRQQTRRFEDEMVVYLRQEHPSFCAKRSEAELRALIQDGVLNACGYDVLLEPDVARYIEFMITIAPDFDRSEETPWRREILTRRRDTGSAKLDAIAARRADETQLRAASSQSGGQR